MTAVDQLKQGNVSAALSSLRQEIRGDAVDAKKRIFLFQLLAIIGDWQKALDQLNVAGELDASAIPMVQTYQETIGCELLRNEIFAGARSPLIMGEPDHWMALMLQAVGAVAAGQWERAEALRDEAFDVAPATSGTIDGVPFEWIADADCRMGPLLEAIVNGRYYWIPFQRIRQMEFEAPCDLRDSVWLPANFVWSSGGTTVGFIPTRYAGSERNDDDAVKLARKTVWDEKSPQTVIGFGQRMLTTDAGDYSLMDIRKVVFNTQDEPSAAGESAEPANG